MRPNTILDHKVIIEILWPNGEKSEHDITVTVDQESFYERDVNATFYATTVWSYINIQYNGSEIKKVKLNEITGIKARIVSKKN